MDSGISNILWFFQPQLLQFWIFVVLSVEKCLSTWHACCQILYNTLHLTTDNGGHLCHEPIWKKVWKILSNHNCQNFCCARNINLPCDVLCTMHEGLSGSAYPRESSCERRHYWFQTSHSCLAQWGITIFQQRTLTLCPFGNSLPHYHWISSSCSATDLSPSQ